MIEQKSKGPFVRLESSQSPDPSKNKGGMSNTEYFVKWYALKTNFSVLEESLPI